MSSYQADRLGTRGSLCKRLSRTNCFLEVSLHSDTFGNYSTRFIRKKMVNMRSTLNC